MADTEMTDAPDYKTDLLSGSREVQRVILWPTNYSGGAYATRSVSRRPQFQNFSSSKSRFSGGLIVARQLETPVPIPNLTGNTTRRHRITLTVEDVEPLLDDELTDAERLARHILLAQTHVNYQEAEGLDYAGNEESEEAFYENYAMSEVGFACIQQRIVAVN
ncbi:hypothetical protein B7494_g7374 [Chlorociboria aeruginascens]|nr:hypothetical protein B7494_g7374 [Chlorociboria aeruginascens]